MKKILFFLLASLIFFEAGAQNFIFNNTGNQKNWPYGNKDWSWNRNAYQKFVYTSPQDNHKMPYRLMAPPNNNPAQKYPLFVMIHGGGEGLGTDCSIEMGDNECQLIWGGKIALDSANKYPSYVFFPQTIGGWWGNNGGPNYSYSNPMDAPTRCVYEIIENILLQNYNIDPDRIYIAGLSNGGRGAWEILERRPDLFAAATPFCGMGNPTLAKTLINNPIWNYQGGQDNNPNPFETQNMYDSLVKHGGNPRRSLYVDRDHWVWVDAYQSKTWMNWIYKQNKKNINILFGEEPFICPGAKLGLGISYGFAEYKWKKDGVLIAGAGEYVYYATQPGTYDVEYKRKDGTWGLSNPIVIGSRTNISAKPVVTLNSTPALKESWETVTLTGPAGAFKYQWSNGSSSQSISTGKSGSYSLNVKDNSISCPSPASDTIFVTMGPDANLAAPTNVTVVPSNASAVVSWNDLAVGEYGYEITYTSSVLSWSNKYVGVLPANTNSTTISGLIPGAQYYLRVRALSKTGFSPYSAEKGFITTNVSNANPVANAGADKTLTLPANSVSFVGSATDSDGTIVSYAWTKQSGPSATISGSNTATLTASNLVAGIYVFRLTVTDNKGATAFDEVSLSVTNGNQPPVANAGADKTITLPTNSTTFNGSGTDPDGTIATYTWTKVSGPAANLSGTGSANLTVTNLVTGSYVFRLTVKDNKGLTASDDVALVVNPVANKVPVANAGADKTITLPVNSTTLSGSGTDSDGSISSYSWSKQSGPTATLSGSNSQTLSLTNLLQGTYVFRLTVTDNKGATAYDEAVVTVNSGVNVAPTANAGADKSLTLPENSVTLNGTGIDSDGTISQYLWTKVSGPAATLTNANTANLSLTNLVAGTYVFRLTVTDNKSATGSDEMVVSVNNAAAISIASFTLVDADADIDISPMANGHTINLATQTYNISFVANTTPSTIGSVQWLWNGNHFKTVQIKPYSLTDNCWPGYICYNGWWRPTVGTHTLTAIPYSGTNGTGEAGAPYSITVNVINSAARQAASASAVNSFEAFEVSVSPNPVKDILSIRINNNEDQVLLTITDAMGKPVYNDKRNNVSETTIDLSSLNMTSGIYYLNVSTPTSLGKVVKITKE